MKFARIDHSQAQLNTARKGYFGGEVKTLQLVGPKDSKEVELLAVYFSAGARTKPHIHEHDQILQIIEGQGIVATETEKLMVSEGDVITIQAGTWHWHGATRNTAMCHISMTFPTELSLLPAYGIKSQGWTLQGLQRRSPFGLAASPRIRSGGS